MQFMDQAIRNTSRKTGSNNAFYSRYGRTWPAPLLPVALNAVFELEFFTVLHKPHIAWKHRPTHDFGRLIEIKMKTPTGAISAGPILGGRPADQPENGAVI
jgi:hypothetical protein